MRIGNKMSILRKRFSEGGKRTFTEAGQGMRKGRAKEMQSVDVTARFLSDVDYQEEKG